MSPRRVQRKRSKGWTKPPGVVNVTRPSLYGNPYKVLREPRSDLWGVWYEWTPCGVHASRADAAEGAVALYRAWAPLYLDLDRLVRDLAGKDLMCYCKLTDPCHADWLIATANADAGR